MQIAMKKLCKSWLGPALVSDGDECKMKVL
jgi:hypothetical protein